jgi:hypothetical protein
MKIERIGTKLRGGKKEERAWNGGDDDHYQ